MADRRGLDAAGEESKLFGTTEHDLLRVKTLVRKWGLARNGRGFYDTEELNGIKIIVVHFLRDAIALQQRLDRFAFDKGVAAGVGRRTANLWLGAQYLPTLKKDCSSSQKAAEARMKPVMSHSCAQTKRSSSRPADRE